MVFKSLVLSILLYGSESWGLTALIIRRLEAFFAMCARRMCKITPWVQWKRRITNKQLRDRLGLASIVSAIYASQAASMAWVC